MLRDLEELIVGHGEAAGRVARAALGDPSFSALFLAAVVLLLEYLVNGTAVAVDCLVVVAALVRNAVAL
jgi:hypothetical protein